MFDIMIRPVLPSDAADICAIYNHYILNTYITFEEEEITSQEIKKRIGTVTARYPWLVYEIDGKVVGYAYANEWKTRRSYRFSVETTVYLHPDYGRKGYGSALYRALFKLLGEMDVHAIIGGISLPNVSSVALHEKMGMTKTAHFKEVGFKFNRWIDVGYWEKVI